MQNDPSNVSLLNFVNDKRLKTHLKSKKKKFIGLHYSEV